MLVPCTNSASGQETGMVTRMLAAGLVSFATGFLAGAACTNTGASSKNNSDIKTLFFNAAKIRINPRAA